MEANQIKAGLEIHQQLDTHKLFCNCPSILRNDEPDFEIKRKLHAVAGESGEIDAAAKYEADIDRKFIYQGYDSVCLVELDEDPPHLINHEALMIGLHIALLLNCEILPISQIMRKTVVDGSNTSGFQRTVLIARNGFIETKNGNVRISNVSLEEDSARIIEKKDDKNVYRLDRLGIPLVEIGTEADIKTPEQCKDAALYIGDVLRSCRVKRGIGTIRQDVNISITGHPRVEIKGFQDVKMFIPVIENEIGRQQENLKNRNLKSEVRKAEIDGKTSFLRPMPGSARLYPETDLPLLRITREMLNKARETLPKLRSDIRGELKEKGLSPEMIKLLSHGDKIEEFESLLKIINDPNFIAKTLFIIPKEIATKSKIDNIDDVLNLDVIESIIYAVRDNKIEKSDVKLVMEKISNGENFDSAIKIKKVNLNEIESEVFELVKEKPGLSVSGYMGILMEKYKEQVNGKDLSSILQKVINNK